MTDLAEALDIRMEARDDAARRAAAFRAAGRHSTRVALLKMVMVFGSLLLMAGIVVIGFFNPFAKLGEITDFSVGSLGVNGSKVTMEQPHLAGFRQDGRPYDMRARSMIQDLKKPNAFDMVGIDGVIGMADKGSATVTADKGHYDANLSAMDLDGNVHVRSNAGYEAFLLSAHIDFKSNHVVSKQPVRAIMSTTTVLSDSLAVSDGGKHLIFDGHVRTHMLPQRGAAETTNQLKGSSP